MTSGLNSKKIEHDIIALYKEVFSFDVCSSNKHNYTILYPYDANIKPSSKTTDLDTSGAVIVLNEYIYSNITRHIEDGNTSESIAYTCKETLNTETDEKQGVDWVDKTETIYYLQLVIDTSKKSVVVSGKDKTGVYQQNKNVGVVINPESHYQALADIITTSGAF